MRYRFLDGIRGWGAIFVLLYHVFCDGLPPAPAFEYLPVFVPFNGTFAVLVFFIVSGFALSARYLAGGHAKPLLGTAAGRYLRLAIPIIGACAVMHVAMLAGAISAERLPKFMPFLTFDPTVNHLLIFSGFDVFFNYSNATTYIGPLWTMRPELLGSYLVLAAALCLRPIPGRILLFCAGAAAFFAFAPTEIGAMLALFLIGAALADAFNRGWIDMISAPVAIALIAIGCLSLLLPYSVTSWSLVGATPLIVGCIALPFARQWLEGSFSKRLGTLSFPLYLIHGPVINIVGEPLMRQAEGLPLRISIDVVVLVVSIAAAIPFIWVNDLAVSTSRRFGLFVVGVTALDRRDVARRDR